jgi:hypothetical protein
MFGNYSYFMRYLEQSVVAGKVPSGLVAEGDYTKYHPLHYNDLWTSLSQVIDNYDTHQGATYSVNGHEDI